MLAKTPVQTLAPPKGGVLCIEAYHRTRKGNAAYAILSDSIKTNRGCMYGRGLYTTRDHAAHMKLIDRYGRFVVKCKINITDFISFDKDFAKRIWGRDYSLKSQLVAYGPWTQVQQKIINKSSAELSLFWSGKHQFGIYNSSDIARQCYHQLGLDHKVPGIFYTGSRDGPCVLTYQIDRVQPLAIAETKNKIKSDAISWLDTTHPELLRTYNPRKALIQDRTIYEQELRSIISTPAKKLTAVRKLIKLVPKSILARLAFLIAYNRVFKQRIFQDFKQKLLVKWMPSVVKKIGISLPEIDFKSNNIQSNNIQRLFVNKTQQEDNTPLYLKAIERQKFIWTAIRQYLFIKQNKMLDQFLKKQAKTIIMQRKIKNLFGIKIGIYGLLKSTSDYKNTQHNDALGMLKEILTYQRNIRLYKGGKYAIKTLAESNPHYKLLNTDTCLQQYKLLLLRLYQFYKDNPGTDDFMKHLAKWYRKYGRQYKKDVEAGI